MGDFNPSNYERLCKKETKLTTKQIIISQKHFLNVEVILVRGIYH